MSEKLFIYGSGGAGRELAFSLSIEKGSERTWDVSGFIDDDDPLWGKRINNVPVKGGFDWLKETGGNVAVATVANPYERETLINRLKGIETVRLPMVVAPGSVFSDFIEWGEGCLVAHSYNYITVNVKIGNFVFINCGNGIGHDVEIGDFTIIYSHIDIGGGVVLGSHCVVGTGVVINPGVTIGNGSIIGAGSVVVKDVPANVTAAGVPVKIIREHEPPS